MRVFDPDTTWADLEYLYQEGTRVARDLLARPRPENDMLAEFSMITHDQKFGCQRGYTRGIMRNIAWLSGRFSREELDTFLPDIRPTCGCTYGYLPLTVFVAGPYVALASQKHSASCVIVDKSKGIIADLRRSHCCLSSLPSYLPEKEIHTLFENLERRSEVSEFLKIFDYAQED